MQEQSEDDIEEDIDEDIDEEESNETEDDITCGTWRLGMNMNPTDGNVMGYATGVLSFLFHINSLSLIA